MEKSRSRREREPGNNNTNEKQQAHYNAQHTKTQKLKALEWLREKPLTTLDARQELFIMSIASTIFKLKQDGHSILTNKVYAGSKLIAQYVLLVGEHE